MRVIILISSLMFFYVACQSPERELVPTHSEMVDIWDNGHPKLVRLFAEIDGEPEAIREIQYHSNGVKSLEGPLLNGERNGLWQSWYEDGNLWSEGNFEKGKRQGKAVVYHPNGRKMLEGQYTDDQRTGLWHSWDEDGNLINELKN